MKIFKKIIGLATILDFGIMLATYVASFKKGVIKTLYESVLKIINENFLPQLSLDLLNKIVLVALGVFFFIPVLALIVTTFQKKGEKNPSQFDCLSLVLLSGCGLYFSFLVISDGAFGNVLVYLAFIYIALALIFNLIVLINVFKGEEVIMNDPYVASIVKEEEEKEKEEKVEEEDFEVVSKDEEEKEESLDEGEEAKANEEEKAPAKEEILAQVETPAEEEIPAQEDEEELQEETLSEEVQEENEISNIEEEEDEIHQDEEENNDNDEIIEEEKEEEPKDFETLPVEEQLSYRFDSIKDDAPIKYKKTIADTMVIEAPNEEVEPFEFEEDEIDEEDESIDKQDFGKIVSKTFQEKLIEADESLKKNYNAIKNALLAYKKVNDRVAKSKETFKFKGNTICVIQIRGKGMKVYLPIDPSSIPQNIYHQIDVSDKKKFESTPSCFKVRSPLSCKKTIELINSIMDSEEIGGVINPSYEEKDYTVVNVQ